MVRGRFYIIGFFWLLLAFFNGCSSGYVDPDFHPGVGIPRLTASDSGNNAFVQFGESIYVGQSLTSTLYIRNDGSAAAYEISPSTLSAPFGFVDGSYPGTGGDCGDYLGAGESCTIKIAFTPTTAGEFSTTLVLTYSTGVSTKTLSIDLAGTGLAGLAATLDTQTFGNGTGHVVTSITAKWFYDYGRHVAMTSDGKILVGRSQGADANADFAISRYLSDGTLDTSFGSAGTVRTPVTAYEDYLYSIVLQSDGKIIAVGQAADSSGNSDAVLVRYLANGTLDTSFGSGGIASHSFVSGSDLFRAAAVQSDGKIVAVGYAPSPGNGNWLIARYTSVGELDASFGSGGYMIKDLGTSYDDLFWVLVQPDGKIIAGGNRGSGSNPRYAVARFLTDGSYDTSWASAETTPGLAITNCGSVLTNNYSVSGIRQPDGKIVVGGFTYIGGYQFSMARYLTDGTLDPAFNAAGTPGTIVTLFTGNSIGRNNDIFLAADGKIIAVGWAGDGTTNKLAIARYTSAGVLDTTWNSTGQLTLSLGSGTAEGLSAYIQPDGKILAVTRMISGSDSLLDLSRWWP